MNLFEAVKQNVTTRQAAELYSVHVGRNGMAVCPFHNDRNPSMEVDKQVLYFQGIFFSNNESNREIKEKSKNSK